MGGYIGATAVGLTTTAADVQGDITSTDTTPELILKNTSEEDTEGGREGKITFKGEQSGGEESTLAQIESAHDGTSDDQKGDLIFKTNDGSDGASPTEAMRISSDQKVGIGTTNPDELLEVAAGNSAAIKITSTDTTIAADDIIGSIKFESSDASGTPPHTSGQIDVIATDAFGRGAMAFSTGRNLDFQEGMRIDEDGKVGIGTSSPRAKTEVFDTNVSGVFDAGNLSTWRVMQVRNNIESNTGTAAGIAFGGDGTGDTETAGIAGISDNSTGGVCQLAFITSSGNNSTERMRIDSSGNALVGKTAIGTATVGVENRGDGLIIGTRSSDVVSILRRNTSDGEVLRIQKDATTVGSIASRSGVVTSFIIDPRSGGMGISGSQASLVPTDNVGTPIDNFKDLGSSTTRWDDVRATNGTIQTSDQNEKQDIEDLSEAELRVATAAKGLIKKFRWKDAVEKKGDDARIHVGIIAQDLQAAFEAEGLDAGRYAMFISDTWWEADRVVPAVEANEEEGIEAVAEHIVTDTFDTQEEAPEGATERTRLGVRYPELLAFIIGAM